MRTLLLPVLCGFLASCFSPDLSNVMFKCSEQDSQCLPGYICRAPLCVPIDSPVEDMSAAAADLQSSADLSTKPADMASDCADGGGFRVGLGWACPGKFGPADRKPATLCAAGFNICTSTKHFTLQDLQDCRKLPGFYSALVLGSYVSDVNLGTCDSMNPTKVIYGCGALSRAQDTSLRCAGFAQVFDCTYRTTMITCPPGAFVNLDQVVSQQPQDGILCCPT